MKRKIQIQSKIFDKCEEIHNHPLGLTGIELTQEMRQNFKIYTEKI